MSLTQIFLFDYLHIEIIILGILVTAVLGLLSSKLTNRFLFLKNRMRLFYGYTVLVFSIISLVIFGYFFIPFGDISTDLGLVEITAFNAGIYLTISFGILFLIFISIVETQFNSEQSYLAFVALLLIQVASFYILASTTWILILLGFIILFSGISLYLRYLKRFNEKNNKETFSTYTLLNGISIAFLFIGLSSHYISNGSFLFSSFNSSGEIWEYLSIIFVITALLIQIGCPPFHYLFFNQSEDTQTSTSQILVIIQRGVVFAFLLKYSIVIKDSKISTILLILFLILGIAYAIFSSIATMTIDRLMKKVHYISLIQMGVAFMLLSGIFSTKLEDSQISSLVQSLSFHSIAYVLIFSFSFAVISLITKGYKTDSLEEMKGLSKKSYLQSFIIVMSFVLQFILPLLTGLFASIFSFETSWIPELYVISIIILITILFTIVYVSRIFSTIVLEYPSTRLKYTTVEPGIMFSLLLSLFFVVGLMIFSFRLIEFCLQMTTSLIGPA